MFLGGAIETISKGDPRSRRSLASVVALVLIAGFFAFFADEARAQQPPQQQHEAVADEDSLLATVEEVAGMAAGASPAEGLLAEMPLAEMLSAEASPVVIAPLAEEPPDGPVSTDPTPVTFDRHGVGTSPVGPGPVWGMLGDTGATQEPGPLPGPEAVPVPTAPWPGALVKNDPPPLPPEERHPAPLPRSETVGAVPAGPSPSTTVQGMPVPLAPGSLAVGYQSPPSPEATASSAAGNLQGGAANVMDARASTHASGGGPSPAPSSSGTGDASEGTPQQEQRPLAPLTPLGGSSFSLSGGQASPGGGLIPLLVCVLASGLVLLRRDGLLFRWAPYEPPKPSSALLLPLERPG